MIQVTLTKCSSDDSMMIRYRHAWFWEHYPYYTLILPDSAGRAVCVCVCVLHPDILHSFYLLRFSHSKISQVGRSGKDKLTLQNRHRTSIGNINTIPKDNVRFRKKSFFQSNLWDKVCTHFRGRSVFSFLYESFFLSFFFCA